MRRKQDINQPKCIRCGKKATLRISPDLDINGIPVCKKCKGDVKFDVFCLLNGVITKEEFYKRNKY